MPQFPFTAGLTAVADLRSLTPARSLDIMVAINQDRERQRVEVSPVLHDRWVDDAAKRATCRAFCQTDLRCRACGATGRGGVVLDCGAGARPQRTTGVVKVEIVD